MEQPLSPKSVSTRDAKDVVIRELLKKVAVLESQTYYDDEQSVQDKTSSFFHQPHVLSAIFAVLGYLLYQTWTASPETSFEINLKNGIFAAAFFFWILGMMTFPTSGPFSKPLPILWRSVFALGVMYEIFLIILLFQNKEDARKLMSYLDPAHVTGAVLHERSYADACDFTWENIGPNIFDRFALAHFIGWFLKSLILRDVFLCWVISIGWEFIEIIFTHMLPNFAECWWDQWLLDVLICNGLGIALGALFQKHFHMMQHNWRLAYSQPTYTQSSQKLIRAFHLEHLDPSVHKSQGSLSPSSSSSSSTASLPQSSSSSLQAQKWSIARSLKRFFGIQFIVLLFQTQELNAFFLKQLLYVPPESFLNPLRLVLWALFSTPCVRQLYLYMTNPNIHSMGRQTFLSITCLCTELMIIFKFSRGEFPTPMPEHIKHLIALIIIGYIVFVVLGVIRIIKQHPQQDIHRQVFHTISNYSFDNIALSQQQTSTMSQHDDLSKNVFDMLDELDHDHIAPLTLGSMDTSATTTTTTSHRLPTTINNDKHNDFTPPISQMSSPQLSPTASQDTYSDNEEIDPDIASAANTKHLGLPSLSESRAHKLHRRQLKDQSRNTSPRVRPLARRFVGVSRERNQDE